MGVESYHVSVLKDKENKAMKYYAQIEVKAAKEAGLISSQDLINPAYIDGKYYTNEMFIVDRNVYEKAGRNHGKFVIIKGKKVRDKYVFAF